MKHWFHRVVLSRRWLTFLVMGLAFFVFGAGTFDIAMLFSANAGFVAQYGWQAVLDGAALQFVELVATGYLSMAAYVVFKVCEYRLARDIAEVVPAQTESDAVKRRIDDATSVD
jgi:hypothetical protein